MRFSIGYRLRGREQLLSAAKEFAPQLSEVYFSWMDMPSGRSNYLDGTDREAAKARMTEDLRTLRAWGLAPNLLLNANCYGADSQKKSFYAGLETLVGSLRDMLGVGLVTTTSPMIAQCIRSAFPDIRVRASVNLHLTQVRQMEYLGDVFDEFYAGRECNRSLKTLEVMRKWCDGEGKRLFLIANSGCLCDCPSHVFHDNLVAHEGEIDREDFVPYTATCWKLFRAKENWVHLLAHTGVIRPEDIGLYEDYADGMKLATRSTPSPAAVIRAYCTGKWTGGLTDLTEPSHSGLLQPYLLENRRLPADFGRTVAACGGDCDTCGYCQRALDGALVNLEKLYF